MADFDRPEGVTDDAYKEINTNWKHLLAYFCVCDSCGKWTSGDPSPVGQTCHCGKGILRPITEEDV